MVIKYYTTVLLHVDIISLSKCKCLAHFKSVYAIILCNASLSSHLLSLLSANSPPSYEFDPTFDTVILIPYQMNSDPHGPILLNC